MFTTGLFPGNREVSSGDRSERLRQHCLLSKKWISSNHLSNSNSPRQVKSRNSKFGHRRNFEGPEEDTNHAGSSTRTTCSRERMDRKHLLDTKKNESNFAGDKTQVGGTWGGSYLWIQTWKPSQAAAEEPGQIFQSGSGSTSRHTISRIRTMGDSSNQTNVLPPSLDPKESTWMASEWWNLSTTTLFTKKNDFAPLWWTK